jgi:hypothetical protein
MSDPVASANAPLREIIRKMESYTGIKSIWETGIFEPGMFREKNPFDEIIAQLEKHGW